MKDYIIEKDSKKCRCGREDRVDVSRNLSFAQGFEFHPLGCALTKLYCPVPFSIGGGSVRYVASSDGYAVLINNYTENCTTRDDLVWEIQLLKKGFLGWNVVHTDEVEAREGYGCDLGHKIVGLGHSEDYRLDYLIREDGEYYVQICLYSTENSAPPLVKNFKTDWSSHKENPVQLKISSSSILRGRLMSFFFWFIPSSFLSYLFLNL